jgi:hypothetical protein
LVVKINHRVYILNVDMTLEEWNLLEESIRLRINRITPNDTPSDILRMESLKAEMERAVTP